MKMAVCAINIDVRNFSNNIRLSGSLPSNTNVQDMGSVPLQPISLFLQIEYTTVGGGAQYTYHNPSYAYCDSDSEAGAISWANRLLAGGVTFPFYTVNSGKPVSDYNSIVGVNMWGNSHLVCNGIYHVWFIPIGAKDVIINPPVQPNSSCSLNSQNLNLSYSSTNLNVNGLTQSTSLSVSCTAGTAQNYRLRLTGTNVTNGRLNFGNGVSAQVSLNGTQVSANGSGISLSGLTSRTIPVSASLVGSATVSGITTANGVLVLDAL